jgi:hypothetical protein
MGEMGLALKPFRQSPILGQRDQRKTEMAHETPSLKLRREADKRGIPLRTLEQVKQALTDAAEVGTDSAMASLMMRHGRLTDDARAYIAERYPQA